ADEMGSSHGFRTEIVYADHQNKPDVGASIARQWYDQGVDLVIDVPTSSVALAVQNVAKEKNKVYINASAGTTQLTGEQCSPNFVHWTFDTYMQSRSTGGALVKQGGDKWYFITANYAFGLQLEKDTTALVQSAGGKVLGSSAYPFPETTDFSSFIVKAMESGANVLGLANAGGDTVNCIKQAQEFGASQRMKPAALLMFINDVHAAGLDTAQGLVLTESFYWDLNDRTRAFTKRVLPRTPSNYPNMNHAGAYAGTLHYLKTVAAMGPAEAKADGRATVARMKAIDPEDDAFGKSHIREDGRNLVNAYLFEIKKPSESTYPWDYYKLVTTTPGPEAFRPLCDGHCYFVKC
ncbi:MAG: ABC transporter substrate-binding protein, partial [Acetobacteraceae bacterium]|nr:ABC transporter substrate-binding protein [Acetobacteraceae bacterium]MBV8521557.1 ABC transporter substrate-binding protein [Acetobacteraceae bacterium]